MNQTARKVVPVVLSVFGSVGVVGTTLLGIKATKKVTTDPNYLNAPENETKWQKFKRVIKPYIPTIAVGAATIASITTSTIISKKTEASLSATILGLDTAYKKYRGKAKQLLGVEADKKIVEAIAKDDTKGKPKELPNGKKLYYSLYTGSFYAYPVDVREAINQMNYELLVNAGHFTLKQFLDAAHAENIVGNPVALDTFGWNADYLGDEWHQIWFEVDKDMEHEPDEIMDSPYIALVFLMPDPIQDPEIWDETRKNLYTYDLNQKALDEAKDLANEYQEGQAELEHPEDDTFDVIEDKEILKDE